MFDSYIDIKKNRKVNHHVNDNFIPFSPHSFNYFIQNNLETLFCARPRTRHLGFYEKGSRFLPSQLPPFWRGRVDAVGAEGNGEW